MANDANAEFLLYGDRDLLDIRGELEHPTISGPREFLELVEEKAEYGPHLQGPLLG